ncbi:hypothetical protein D9M71_672060 [compost metagenome]
MHRALHDFNNPHRVLDGELERCTEFPSGFIPSANSDFTPGSPTRAPDGGRAEVGPDFGLVAGTDGEGGAFGHAMFREMQGNMAERCARPLGVMDAENRASSEIDLRFDILRVELPFLGVPFQHRFHGIFDFLHMLNGFHVRTWVFEWRTQRTVHVLWAKLA